MIVSPVYRPHPETPATASLSSIEATGAFAGLDARQFEVVSRGDFVPGLLYLPPQEQENSSDSAARVPLVLLQHGLGGSKESPYLDFAARWVREGFAVAAIDLPLHGARSSPKLSARLVQGIEHVVNDERLDAETHALVEEFARQSTSDLIRTLDAISVLDPIDPDRIGYVGFSLGAVVGSYLMAHDARPKVAVLALAGGARGPVELDPATYVGQGSARPLLVIAAKDDKVVSAASSRALFDAASEPKELFVSPADHDSLNGKTLGKIQTFLSNAFER